MILFYFKGYTSRTVSWKFWLYSDYGIRLNLNNFVFFSKKYKYLQQLQGKTLLKLVSEGRFLIVALLFHQLHKRGYSHFQLTSKRGEIPNSGVKIMLQQLFYNIELLSLFVLLSIDFKIIKSFLNYFCWTKSKYVLH